MNVIQKKLFRLQSHLSQTQYIAYGFMGIILMGSLLLMLPVSSKSGTVTPFLECLFTATSASCVTGLIVYDTWTHWSIFGQLVILTMIQIAVLDSLPLVYFCPLYCGGKLV